MDGLVEWFNQTPKSMIWTFAPKDVQNQDKWLISLFELLYGCKTRCVQDVVRENWEEGPLERKSKIQNVLSGEQKSTHWGN